MRTVDGSETTVLGEVDKIAVVVGDMTHALIVLVVKYSHFSLIKWKKSIENNRALLDFENDISTSWFEEQTVTSNSAVEKDKEQGSRSLSNEFTSKQEVNTD